MTLKQVIDLVDGIEPNGYGYDVKTAWLNEVEGMVQTDVMLRAIEDIDQYTWADDQQTVLLVKPPHDKLYRFYLQAMIQFANGEYDRYSNTMTVFNGAYGEFVRWFSRTVYPAGREAVWRGYYISAYGIAVAHGYSGTEAEWLESLHGEDGTDAYEGAVEAGYEGTREDFFRILASVDTLASAAASSASDAAESASEAASSATDAAESASEAQAALEEFTTPTASAETLPSGSPAAASYSAGRFLFGIPRGGDGYSPHISVSNIPGGHRVTVTDAQGSQVFDVMDGDGSGDMTASTYDPAGGARQVAFADEIPTALSQLSGDSEHRAVTDAEKAAWNRKGSYSKPSGGIPKSDLADPVKSSLDKADSALQSYTETDPTVPSWAKQSSKPSYTASEVGAIPASEKGAAGGIASLDSNGKVPDAQLPLPWTATKSYAAGAYCVHNGYLWHNTSGAASTGVEPGTNYNIWNVTYSNPNLLDNWYFVNPVNQRGQSSYTGNGYTVDRWSADGGGTSVSASGVTLAPSVGVLHQYFEDDVWKSLGGRQVTLSIMTADGTVYSHTRSCPDYKVGVDAEQIPFANGWKYQLYSRSSELQVRIFNGTSDVSIRAVKLELGSVSTLANDAAPNYEEELARCQRYFYCFNSKAKNYLFTGASIDNVGGAPAVWFAIPTPVAMRTSPSVTVVQQGAIAVRENGHSPSFNSSDSTIRADRAHPNQITMLLIPNEPPSYWTQHYVPVVEYTTGSVETILFVSADL